MKKTIILFGLPFMMLISQSGIFGRTTEQKIKAPKFNPKVNYCSADDFNSWKDQPDSAVSWCKLCRSSNVKSAVHFHEPILSRVDDVFKDQNGSMHDHSYITKIVPCSCDENHFWKIEQKYRKKCHCGWGEDQPGNLQFATRQKNFRAEK
jgi:hypothetical protein